MEKKLILCSILLGVLLLGSFAQAYQLTGRFIIKGNDTVDEVIDTKSGETERYPTGEFVAVRPMSTENQLVVIVVLMLVLGGVYFLFLRKCNK